MSQPLLFRAYFDLVLKTGGRPGGSCTAALFLKAFADGIVAKDGKEAHLKWAHVDIAGSMEVFEHV